MWLGQNKTLVVSKFYNTNIQKHDVAINAVCQIVRNSKIYIAILTAIDMSLHSH